MTTILFSLIDYFINNDRDIYISRFEYESIKNSKLDLSNIVLVEDEQSPSKYFALRKGDFNQEVMTYYWKMKHDRLLSKYNKMVSELESITFKYRGSN